jgi:sugar fermentation stimulation protein A
MKYKFSEPLISGIIRSRPNRFIMMVEIDGKVLKCHCPSTGRIGNVIFSNVPCLLSKGRGERKTPYTVEAIFVKKWIGINQTKANTYVKFFLEHGLLPAMFSSVKKVQSEVTVGDSRFDFLVNEKDFLEVKTPLITLPGQEYDGKKLHDVRLRKHFSGMAKHVGRGRAIVALCFMYDAKPFAPPAPTKQTMGIHRAARRATEKGVENWQINLKIDKNGISLIRYFSLKLFPD